MLVRDMEVPDPVGAPDGWDGGPLGPSAPLVPFRPEPLEPDDVVGATVQGWTAHAGTYGMGGPGFVALDLGAHHLVVTVWGPGRGSGSTTGCSTTSPATPPTCSSGG